MCRFLRTGHPLGLAPKKSLALQAGQTASPGVTPVSGGSGADVGAALADPTAPMVAPTPAEVTERAASSTADVEQPAEDRIPLVEVVVTAPSQDQPGAVVVAPKGVVQSAPPGAQVDPPMALEAAQTGEGPRVRWWCRTHEVVEMNPPASEQGAGSKRSRPDKSGQGSGDPSPKRFRRPRASA